MNKIQTRALTDTELERRLQEGAADAIAMMQAETESLVIWVIPETSWADKAYEAMESYVLGRGEGVLNRDTRAPSYVSLVVANQAYATPLLFVLLEDLPKILVRHPKHYVVDDQDACRLAVSPIDWQDAWNAVEL